MMVTLVKRECQERWKPAMNSVIKGAGYVLVHTPEMVVYNGTTQTTERVVNPESEYLKDPPEIHRHFRHRSQGYLQ